MKRLAQNCNAFQFRKVFKTCMKSDTILPKSTHIYDVSSKKFANCNRSPRVNGGCRKWKI